MPVSFNRARDSIAICRPTYNLPSKDDPVREFRRRLLEKKYESSPNLARKKEAISQVRNFPFHAIEMYYKHILSTQERERQSDLVRDMVMSRIQRSPEKKERRGSYGSLTPPSSQNSRAGSEARTDSAAINVLDSKDILSTPSRTTPVKPASITETVHLPTPSTCKTPILPDGEAALLNAKRDLFSASKKQDGVNPQQSVVASEFKTPYLKQRQPSGTCNTGEREAARLEARAKAQAKADQDLGLSPPDYIENLRDKLRRKGSVSEDEQAPTRTRSFSEPQSDGGQRQPDFSGREEPSMEPTDVGMDKSVRSKSSHIVSESQASKPSHSVPQVLSPPSPKSDVIRSMFLSQNFYSSSELSPQRSPSSPATSPPQSPRSVGSSKSSSYLWAGLSPDDSESKAPSEDPSPSAVSRTVSL